MTVRHSPALAAAAVAALVGLQATAAPLPGAKDTEELGAPLAAAAAEAAPSGAPHLFLREVDYGSDSQFSPLSVWVNGSFDILRNVSYSRQLLAVSYREGALNLAENLTHPLRTLRTTGLRQFIAHEVLPIDGLSPRYGQWVPNYLLHVAGEGMLYRKLGEWYEARGAPLPRVCAYANLLAMQLMNEITENGAYRGPNADPVADFYLFNPLGILLFSLDPVAELFSGHLLYWPGQPVLTGPGLQLLNHGENYALRVPLELPWTAWRPSLFAYFGVQGLFGLSVPVRGGDALSLGVGYRLLELKAEAGGGSRTLVPGSSAAWEAGLFWDRRDSLLASLVVGIPPSPSLALNVYPGVLRMGPASVGFFVRASHFEGVAAGITLGALPLGVGAASTRDSPVVAL